MSSSITKIAILLGFSYHQATHLKTLPGVLADLKRVYGWVEKANFDRIIVITDNLADQTLLQLLSQRQQLYLYQSQTQVLNCLLLTRPHQRIFFYFTGHGQDQAFLLPDHQVLTFRRISQDLLLPSSGKQIVCLIDCCYGGNFRLPYQLEATVRLVKKASNFYPGEIIALVSSQPHQKSFGDRRGSLFTHTLFKFLASDSLKRTNLLVLRQHLQREITNLVASKPSFWLSRPNLLQLWPWFFPTGSRLVWLEPLLGTMTLLTA